MTHGEKFLYQRYLMKRQADREALFNTNMRYSFGVINPKFSTCFEAPSTNETSSTPTKCYIATTKLIMLTIKVLKWLGN